MKNAQIILKMLSHRTPEWYQARIGKFTASNFAELMSKPADKSALISKSAQSRIERAATQLYYNKYFERPDSDSTLWGMRHEKSAIERFSKVIGFDTEEAGFLVHPDHPDIGATPDAIVKNASFHGEVVIAQIKCPYNGDNHLKYIAKIKGTETLKKSKLGYYWQMQGEMWVTGAAHSYFVSYDPRTWELNNIHIVKIDRVDEDIAVLEKRVVECLALRNELLLDFRLGNKRPDISKYTGIIRYWR